MKALLVRLSFIGLFAALALNTSPVLAASRAFTGSFNTVSTISSTVPSNGDVNPYGVAVVPKTIGHLVKGDILISNFNNSANLQGTGTTIVEISPSGHFTQFAQIQAANLPGACPGGVGLTTALVVLRSGWVIVGSLPTADGSSATAQAGCLIVLNAWGHVVETISGGLINGPWDMTARDNGKMATLFVSNVLNGTVAASPSVVNQGTVVRIELSVASSAAPQMLSSTVVGSGFGERTDPNALVIGPTGLGLDSNGTLYVADTQASRIAAIPQALSRTSSAGTGTTVSVGQALNGPLGLAVAPGGNVVVVNGGDGNLVEVTPMGQQVNVENIDVTGVGGGTLFGLAIVPNNKGVYFVNDGNNTLDLLH